ncbi:NADH:ubiquinone oxidoreductase subunit NDUFA12 [Amorphus sp. 3PC139-8]|uniref:NADH:ubiquinone oxidoreductase subunit NDUFA12 n=1 Tax=Amorphus sp. 3PC139-8 TaxID=2735676 RepID=UPI00345DC1C8
MKRLFLDIFTWWNSATIGTRVHTYFSGEFVGEDEFGNRYYRSKGGKVDPTLGFQRRWVIFKGEAEATKIPSGWHGWMHHKDVPAPSEVSYKPREWEKPFQPNLTGTAGAYRPKGSIVHQDPHRPQATGDYDAWSPGQ